MWYPSSWLYMENLYVYASTFTYSIVDVTILHGGVIILMYIFRYSHVWQYSYS